MRNKCRHFVSVFDKPEDQRKLVCFGLARTDERSKSRDRACLGYALQGGRRRKSSSIKTSVFIQTFWAGNAMRETNAMKVNDALPHDVRLTAFVSSLSHGCGAAHENICSITACLHVKRILKHKLYSQNNKLQRNGKLQRSRSCEHP